VGGLGLDFPTNYVAAAATHYGDIRSRLEKAGTPIGPLDTLIAAHGRSLNALLITNNLGEFRRVPGLKVEDWI
jgi:tRNA(fMet)-specific endonuclease VapC